MFSGISFTSLFNSELFSSQAEQQSCMKQHDSSSHSIEQFYQDFLVIQKNNALRNLVNRKKNLNSSMSQKNNLFSSQYSNKSFGQQGQILYLKQKRPQQKYVDTTTTNYDHIAIKANIISQKQRQHLQQRLENEMSQRQDNKFHRIQNVQLIKNYYIEEIKTMCSSYTYAYLVYERWQSRVFDKILQLIAKSKDHKDQLLSKRENQVQTTAKMQQKQNTKKYDSNHTLITFKNRSHLSGNNSTQSSHSLTHSGANSPIIDFYKSLSTRSSRFASNPGQHSNHNWQQNHLQIPNSEHEHKVTHSIVFELLQMIASIVPQLQYMHKYERLPSDFKVGDILLKKKKDSDTLSFGKSQFANQINYRHNIKTDATDNQYQYLIKNQLLSEYLHQDTAFNKFTEHNYIIFQSFNLSRSAVDSIQQESYPSPEELSQIRFEQRSFQYSDENRNQILYDSLMFKLGMIVLELWNLFEMISNLFNKNQRDSQHHYEIKSIKGKVYLNSSKINWLEINNFIQRIEERIKSLSFCDQFIITLRFLLNRSASERRKVVQFVKNLDLSSFESTQNDVPLKNNIYEETSLLDHGKEQFKRCQIQNQKQINTNVTYYPRNQISNKFFNYYETPKFQNFQSQESQSLFLQAFPTFQNTKTLDNPQIVTQRRQPQSQSQEPVSKLSFLARNKVINRNQSLSKSQNQSNFHRQRFANYSQKFTPQNQYLTHQQKRPYNETTVNHFPLSNQNKVTTISTVVTFYPKSNNFQSTEHMIRNKTLPQSNLIYLNNEHPKHLQTYSVPQNKPVIYKDEIDRNEDNNKNVRNDEFELHKQSDKKIPSYILIPSLTTSQHHTPIETLQKIQTNQISSVNQNYFPSTKSNLFQSFNPNNSNKSSQQVLQFEKTIDQQKQIHSIGHYTEQNIPSCNYRQQVQSQYYKYEFTSSNNPKTSQKSNQIIIRDNQNDFLVKSQLQTFNRSEEFTRSPTQQHHQNSITQKQVNGSFTPNDPLNTGVQIQQDTQPQYVIQEYKGGARYEGYMKNKKKHGYGKLFYYEGSRYQGQWINDTMDGYGKLYYSNGQLAYQGHWKHDQFHGSGKVYNDNPTMLDDSFDYTNFNNLQEQWVYYEGQLQNDLKQGHGTIMLQNGEFFEGDFHKDRINGQGKFTDLEGEVIYGVWKDNVMIEMYN